MKRVLLISVAAIGLAAASGVSLAQTKNGAAGAGTTAQSTSPSGSAGGTMSGGAAGGASNLSATDTPMPGTAGTPGAAGKGAQDRTIPEKKSTQAPAPSRQGQADHKGTKQGASERNEGTRHGASERNESTTKQGASETTTKQGTSGSTTRQGANERPMTSKSVSLTTEQKTTIRKTVLTGSAPRVTNVNFDIKVGTVVPRTVRIAPVPTTIVEIEPEWRGYMYFVYSEEIIIVNPRTLEIVAVLEV